MKNTPVNLRSRLLLFTACTFAAALATPLAARAQNATPVAVPGDGSSADLNAYQIQKVKILYKKLLLREKDIPNAVTDLGQKQVQAENPTTGSIQTLLKQSPSVVAYTQQPGQDNSTLAIRGVRNDELSETLDGIPINNLLNGSMKLTAWRYFQASPSRQNRVLVPPAARSRIRPSSQRMIVPPNLRAGLGHLIPSISASRSTPAASAMGRMRRKRCCCTIKAKPPVMFPIRQRNSMISC